MSSADIYYVSPNRNCFNASIICYDFDTYLEDFAQYFTSDDTTFVFLPGEHIISQNINNINGLKNFEFVGVGDFTEHSIDYNVRQYGFDSYSMDSSITYSSSSSIIVCNTSTYFSFSNMADLTIANLTIFNCGQNGPAAMYMNNINSLIMDGVSVQNSTGYGLLGLNVIGNSQITRSSFIGNNQYVKGSLQRKLVSEQSCNPIIEYRSNGTCEVQYMGGNVLLQYIDNGGGTSNSLLISSCLFSLGLNCNYGNLSSVSSLQGTGLVLYLQAYSYTLSIYLINITSYRNQAYYGAGISIHDLSLTSSITMENIHVISGVAFYGGGISYLTNDTAQSSSTFSPISISNSIFTNNYAGIKGSSLYVGSLNQQGQNNNNLFLVVSMYESLLTCEVGYSSLDVQASNSSVMFNASYMDWHNNTISNIAMFSGNNSVFVMNQCNLQSSGYLVDVTNSTFHSNSSKFSDATIGIQLFFSTAVIYRSILRDNLQGAITVNSSIQFNDCIFTGNGAAITASQTLLNVTSGTLLFNNNSCGAIQLFLSTLIVQNSDIHFLFNNACVSSEIYGGALYINQSLVSFINSSVQFIGNNADVGGAVYHVQSSSNFVSSKLQCSNNTAKFLGGCMYLLSSSLSLDNTSNTIFSQNQAYSFGGALFFSGDSILDVTAPSEVVFSSNSASLSGGAIYVQSYVIDSHLPQSLCFYNLSDPNGTLQSPNIAVSFYNNSAQAAGSVLYGGNIDTCTPRTSTYNANSNEIFDTVFQTGNSTNTISSPPFIICKCPMLNSSVCDVVDTFDTPLYPGQQIVIQFAAVGQRNGIAPAVVLPVVYNSNSKSIPIILPPLLTGSICHNYSIPHYLNDTSMVVVTQNSFDSNDLPFSNFTIKTVLLPCPLGFSLNWTNSSLNNVSYCQCSPVLSGQVTNCNISDVTIQKVTQYVWIGTAFDGTVAYSEYCLHEACLNSSTYSPEDPNSQCTNGHTGVMCSRCEPDLSVTLGLPKCQRCSNYFLLLSIAFAAMGLVFTALLVVFNLTVFTGTMNGLLWYTFVINQSYFIFFNTNVFNRYEQVLFTFAAWLNFDFGIVSCLYEGMDIYYYTWLQLAYPLFIFILIGTTIIGAHCSRTISKLCRSNAVPVLATLIYISFSKLIRMSVAALFPVKIVSAHGARWMWLYDGNMEYLDGRHLALAVFALLLLLCIIFPYTAILLFSPWLQRFSHMKYLLWVNKLKPFLDNYQAPYKDQFRYWTGATLLLRFILCIITTYYSNNPDVILLVIIVLHVSIILIAGIAVYKNWMLSVLESFFHINMTIMATLLLFYGENDEFSKYIVVLIGIGSSLLCFILILSYHVFHYLICVICKCPRQQDRFDDDDDIIQAPERDQLLRE